MNGNGLVIRRFDTRGAPDDEYLAMWAHRMRGLREARPELPETPADEFILQARSAFPGAEIMEWAAWDASGSSIAASGRVMMETSGHDPRGTVVWISVEPRHRRMGIARRLLGLIADRAESWDRSLLRIQTSDRCSAGAVFMQRLGARMLSESHTDRLLPSGVDRDLLNRWMMLPEAPGLGIEIEEWRGEVPGERLQDICVMFQEVHDSEPLPEGFEPGHVTFTPEKVREGERLSRENGILGLALGAYSHTATRLTGFTSISWRLSQPEMVYQNYTAVLPAFRRMGLAKRLKAEMLDRVLRDMPQAEAIITGNDDTNEAILRINRELGFEHFIARADWVVEITKVQEYLERRSEGQ